MKMISARTHTIIGLAIGAALLVAPWLFGFSDNAAASATAWIIGVVVLLSELIATSPISPLKLVPMKTHMLLDYIAGAILALSPILFGFISAPLNAWLPHALVGIVIVGYALMTDPAAESSGTHAAAL